MHKQIRLNYFNALIVAVSLLLPAALIGVAWFNAAGASAASESDTATATAEVDNSSPTVSATVMSETLPPDTVDTNIDLNANDSKTVYCRGEVTDLNSCTEISDVEAVYYYVDSEAVPPLDETCTNNSDNCYHMKLSDFTCAASTASGEDCTGSSDNTVYYNCYAQFSHFADYTDDSELKNWKCNMRAANLVDEATVWGEWSENPGTAEVNTLRALDVSSSINYGTVNLGANTGATNQTVVVTNVGNVAIDTQISGTNMPCSVRGTIYNTYQRFYHSAFTYGDTGPLTLMGTAVGLNVSFSSSGDPAYDNQPLTGNTYWGIGMPTANIFGTCSGTNTFTAVAPY
jgi:hypothetical protein